MGTKTTMRQVAAQAKVSTAVVSRVLNNRPAVKPETRRRVLTVMHRLNYEPDTRGRGTAPGVKGQRKRRRTGRIFFLTLDTEFPRIAPVYLEVIGGAERLTRESDRRFELKCVPPDTECPVEEIVDAADGVLLLGSTQRPDIQRLCCRVPCIQVMGAAVPGNSCDHVSYDNESVGRMAAQFLLDRDHRHCALLRYEPGIGIFSERCRLFRETIRQGGGTVTDLTISSAPGVWTLTDPNGLRVLAETTGVFAVAAILHAPLQGWLLQARTGRDSDVVVCNLDIPYLRTALTPPAVVDIRSAEVGRRAVRQLLWRIDHPRELPERVIVNVQLIEPQDVLARCLGETPPAH